jgi:preprotein translocase subunit SecF
MNVREAVATFRGHRAPHFRIIERRRLWFALSGFFVLLSLVGLIARGLNYSVDFQGGAQLKYPDRTGISADDVRSILARFGRSDAQVQVVAGAEGAQIAIRTRSLNDLGGPPRTQLTFPNTGGVSAQDLQPVLAGFGLASSSIKVTPQTVEIRSKPLASLSESPDVVLTYKPSKDVTVKDIETTLRSLGRSDSRVAVAGGIVAIETTPLTPTPTPTPSASASPSGSPSASASATPSASPSATPTPSVSASPSAADVKKALATQAGIAPADIRVRQLSSVKPADVIAALAEKAGVTPADVKTKQLGGDERARLLAQLADQAGVQTSDINIRDFTATWGSQISKKALQGLIIFLILVTCYIAFRFEWKMALSALVALGHDLIITVGIYALVGREVTPASVIAILTILGYSLYDTVVIFDRVKENTESVALVARDTYSGVVNLSLNETLMRSVNTSLVVLLPILTLLLFGGETLKDFAFALFVGVASGTYSSIFIASPLLAVLKEREPRYQQVRMRALRSAAKPRPALRAVPAGSSREVRSGDGETQPAAAPTERRAAVATTAQRPSGGKPKPKGKGKKKTTAAKRRRR